MLHLRLLTSLLGLAFAYQTVAQTIDGRLLDQSMDPIAYATIQLFDTDSALIKYATSDESGSFSLPMDEAGAFIITFRSLGFEPKTMVVNTVSGSGRLGDVFLNPLSTELGAVEITEEKALITVEPDKTVFNVSSSANTAGDNGVELLRKAPGLQVDNDDNLIIEGKSGALIYVNGKQSFLQGEDLKNYLRSLNADEIESIEIITQPSSKYDAAGSAGIINIILKREKGLGMKGSIVNTLIYGDFARNSTAVTLNYRQKKFAVFGSYSHFQGKATGFFDMYREQAGNVFDLTTRSVDEFFNDQATVTFDYYLSSKSSISASVNASRNDEHTEANSTTLIGPQQNFSVDSVLLAPNENDKTILNLATTLNYTFKGDEGEEFSIDADWVEYRKESQSFQPNYYTTPNEEQVLSENINFQNTPIQIRVLSAQTDYERSLWVGKMTVGAKTSQVVTENVFDFYDVEYGERVLNEVRSNTFHYTEVIGAGYVNYAFDRKKWKFQGGLRAEQTFSEGDLRSTVQTQNKVVNRQYLNWFPSAGATYQLRHDNTLALIYSRRIQRPNYSNLNPFESQINELSFRRGNPFLQPQFTHNIKLSNTYKYTLNTSFSYSYVSDYFAEVTEAEGDRASFINTRNVADQQTYNLSVSYPRQLTDWWNVYFNAYAYYTKYTANHPDFLPIDQFTYGGYGQSSFTFLKHYKAEVSGWFSSPSIWRGTYRTKSLGALNVAFQRSWEKWTVKLSFNDVLYTIPWRAETRFGDLYLTGTGGNDSRNVRCYISYNFGHTDVVSGKDRKGSAEVERERL